MITARTVLSTLGCIGLLATASASHAVTLTYGGADFLGVVVTCVPSNPAAEAVCIDTLAGVAAGTSSGAAPDLYDRTDTTLGDGPFPAASFVGKDDSGSNSVTVTGTYLYVLGKYDNLKGGSLVWYNPNGFSGTITVDEKYGGTGISHISFWNGTGDDFDVPEPGSLALLGLGLLGLGMARRRRVS